jgi:hypothetical protein
MSELASIIGCNHTGGSPDTGLACSAYVAALDAQSKMESRDKARYEASHERHATAEKHVDS